MVSGSVHGEFTDHERGPYGWSGAKGEASTPNNIREGTEALIRYQGYTGIQQDPRDTVRTLLLWRGITEVPKGLDRAMT